MPKQINSDNFESKGSGLDTQDSTSTSKNTLRETEAKPVLKVEVEEGLSFSERWKTNRFWLIRGTYYVLYSVWMTVIVIAGFIAWLISFLFI